MRNKGYYASIGKLNLYLFIQFLSLEKYSSLDSLSLSAWAKYSIMLNLLYPILIYHIIPLVTIQFFSNNIMIKNIKPDTFNF